MFGRLVILIVLISLQLWTSRAIQRPHFRLHRKQYYTPQRCDDAVLSSSSNATVVAVASATSKLKGAAVAGTGTPTHNDLYQLSYAQSMTAGAISRTLAQTIMHPANTYKTLLQLRRTSTSRVVRITPERLLKGVDAQFLLALPHGAFYFFVIDEVKKRMKQFMPEKLDVLTDLTSSGISTVICSIISTPQMVLTDRLMADMYPSFGEALRTIIKKEGVLGFYTGWWPALAQKIPSYSLTWMFFQQLQRTYLNCFNAKPNSEVNFCMGAVAAAASVTVMNPMDTVKTRLVTQIADGPQAYKGVVDCFMRVMKEEGVGAFYRSLAPRLLSVVPMIAIQFAVYEYMKTNYRSINKIEYKKRMVALKGRIIHKPPVLVVVAEARRDAPFAFIRNSGSSSGGHNGMTHSDSTLSDSTRSSSSSSSSSNSISSSSSSSSNSISITGSSSSSSSCNCRIINSSSKRGTCYCFPGYR